MMTLYDVIILNVILGVFCYVSNLETLCFIRWNTLFHWGKHFVPARETIFTRCLFTTIWRYAYILWRLMSCLNCLLFRCLHRIWRYDVYFIYFSRNQYFLFMIAVLPLKGLYLSSRKIVAGSWGLFVKTIIFIWNFRLFYVLLPSNKVVEVCRSKNWSSIW